MQPLDQFRFRPPAHVQLPASLRHFSGVQLRVDYKDPARNNDDMVDVRLRARDTTVMQRPAARDRIKHPTKGHLSLGAFQPRTSVLRFARKSMENAAEPRGSARDRVATERTPPLKLGES